MRARLVFVHVHTSVRTSVLERVCVGVRWRGIYASVGTRVCGRMVGCIRPRVCVCHGVCVYVYVCVCVCVCVCVLVRWTKSERVRTSAGTHTRAGRMSLREPR